MRTTTLIALAIALCGCAAHPPYRTLETVDVAHCQAVFEAVPIAYSHAGAWSETRDRIEAELRDADRAPCWRNSQEIHRDYDLLTVEFDDQGWLAVPRGAPAGENAMTRLARHLKGYSARNESVTLVVYTHGWHHSADPRDRDVIAFRHLLKRLALLEQYLCDKRTAELGINCSQANHGMVQPWQSRRRVVGIYVGWRGDSIAVPFLDNLSVWDRKLAAEKVAYGAIQELYARLHDYYAEHGCRSSYAPPSCLEDADVRMLTIGHSFGGLITYRALAPRLMSAIVERTDRRYPDRLPYAFSFGDLTVLINPAFEATRLEHLARAAIERQYNTGHGKYTAQLPVLIMAQSAGDTATEWAFPAFRRVTTLFEETRDDQYLPNVTAAGWSDRYKTHDVSLDGQSRACPGWSAAGDLPSRVTAEACHTERLRKELYKPFHGDLELCGGLTLRRHERQGKPIDFTPIWSLRVDKEIIDDHNDFLNMKLQQLFRQIFAAYLREQDQYQIDIAARKLCAEGKRQMCEAELAARRKALEEADPCPR